MAAVTIQVFEHETLRIGGAVRTMDGSSYALTAREHDALARFADDHRDRYFSCGRRTVRFNSYVGVLQVGRLGIEVLPKADRQQVGGHAQWHRALLEMLRVVGDLGLEAPDAAQLKLDPGRLFELFIARFLHQCERLVHQGLAKGYRTEEANRSAFRGRLRVAEHIRKNAANAARFYVASPTYDHENLPNLALAEALRVVETLPLSAFTRSRARALRLAFPELPRWRPVEASLRRLRLTRNTARYEAALRLAALILFRLAPSLRRGQVPLLALLFDMNSLFERYVGTLARRLRLPGIRVRTQDAAAFWRQGSTRTLRPDLTLRDEASGAVRLIVDTKWKVPKNGQPASSDLKQMFCYHELFDCPRSLLLYPATGNESVRGRGGKFVGREHRCELGFLSLQEDPRTELQELLGMATAKPADRLRHPSSSTGQ